MELCKILLHLSDSFALDDFVVQRRRAMVSLASLCPDLVVPYLTAQFYQPNYSLRHRMDVLEVGGGGWAWLSGCGQNSRSPWIVGIQ